VKFCYCADCKELRPRSWYHRGDCLLCGKECKTIVIPMSIYGYLMYILSVVGAVFVVVRFGEVDIGLGDIDVYIMFGSIILALLFSSMELGRATRMAKERVGRVH
jgi:hypothetical protein